MEDHNYIKKALEEKKKVNKTLKWATLVFAGLIVLALLAIIVQLFLDPGNIYTLVALAVIVVWFGILIGYYAWAIYFYNINLGLTDEDWAEIRERKKYNPEGVDEPKENPNINQTLGLPTGTVRGTVALTLLIGGLAMTIAGFGMDSTHDASSFLVDNFEFFKTAFLMMIAFYFGNKSLEMLGYKSTRAGKSGKDSNNSDESSTGDTDSPTPVLREGGSVKSILKKVTGSKDNKKDAEKKEHSDFHNPEAAG